MAGYDASPHTLYDAVGGPAFVSPARDEGAAKFDASLILGYAADPAPDVEHLATVTTALYARPMEGLRVEFVVPVLGTYGAASAISAGDIRTGAAVRLADGAHGTVTITPSCWLPTGSRRADLGAGVFSGGGVVSAGAHTGRLELVGNAGARVGRYVSPQLGASFAVDVTPSARLAVWTAAHGDGASTDTSVLLGASTRLQFAENEVVLSAGKGLGAHGPDWQATVAFVPRPAEPLPVPRIDPLQSEVRFEPDGDFAGDARGTMFLLAKAMKADPSLTIVVMGHSDPGLPVEVSTGRAQQVADWLVLQGVAPQRLPVLGLAGVGAVAGTSGAENDWVGFARVGQIEQLSALYP